MGGAGVAGVLTDEAAFLNPASLAFFNSSSVFVQKDTGKLTSNNIAQPNPKSLGFVLADGNPSLSGSLSYVTQEEDIYKRKRWGLTLSSPMSERSSFGVSARQTTDSNISNDISSKYYQAVFGVTHIVDDRITLGVVAYDPFKSKGNETKALVGIQYGLASAITANFDFGGNYYADDISETLLYRGALQIRVLDDFYLHFGAFNDKTRAEKGNGYGLAWIQPRLSFEFALKNTKRDSNISLNQTSTNFKETSFSGSIKF